MWFKYSTNTKRVTMYITKKLSGANCDYRKLSRIL